MGDSEDQSVLAQYLNINLAVVEVRNGESQEEAWRRYLADHPEKRRGPTSRFSTTRTHVPANHDRLVGIILYGAH